MSAFPEVDRQEARASLGVLYRVEPNTVGPGVPLLVQSFEQPDWQVLPARYLAPKENESGPSQSKDISNLLNNLQVGHVLSFRLRANPTKKIETGKAHGIDTNGRRVGLRSEEECIVWLQRKAAASGFELMNAFGTDDIPNVRVRQEAPRRGESGRHGDDGGGRLSFASTLFEGALRIVDKDAFLKALSQGIGSGKAFGFGLLSIAPLREDG